jgi:hypothetical protein
MCGDIKEVSLLNLNWNIYKSNCNGCCFGSNFSSDLVDDWNVKRVHTTVDSTFGSEEINRFLHYLKQNTCYAAYWTSDLEAINVINILNLHYLTMGLINCYHNHPHNLDNHLFSFPWIYLVDDWNVKRVHTTVDSTFGSEEINRFQNAFFKQKVQHPIKISKLTCTDQDNQVNVSLSGRDIVLPMSVILK